MQEEKLLIDGSRELGVVLTPNQLLQFGIYLQELRRWNEKINLTAVTDPEEIAVKHFLDSLAYVKGFTPRQDMEILDIGTGPGFPGLPIKIAFPQIRLSLLESRHKKTAWLTHICRLLGLGGVTIHQARAEEFAKNPARQAAYEVVFCRALADLFESLRLCWPMVSTQGRLVISSGPKKPEDAAGVDSFLKKNKAELTEIEFILPGSKYRRKLLVFQNTLIP